MAISARIDELKKKFDENPRRYFASLANEYRKAGDLDQALFICQEYLPQQPGHMSGHIVLAQTLYEMGKLADAKTEFEAALALDPENLIALRHLGDIARQSGDPRTARNWYQRVLEADPRNAEIVDVLASLRTTPMASAAAISAIPPTPLSTPVMSAPPAPAASAAPPAAAPIQEAPIAREEHELLDFDSIALGETPLSTPVVKAPAEQTASTDDSAMTVEQSSPDLDLADATFEADAFAIAAPEQSAPLEPTTTEPPIDSATDIELGLIEEEFAPASPRDVEPVMLEGLRSYEAGTLIKGNEPIDKSLDTEPYYDVLHGTGRSTPPDSAHPAHATPPSDDDFAPGLVEHFETNLGAENQTVSEVADVDEFAVTPPASSTPVEGLESFEDEDQDFAAPEFAIPQDFSTSPEFSAPDESATPHRDATPVASFTPVSSTPVSSEMPVEPSVPVSAADDTPGRATTPAGSSEIFVTETMADLYLSQGHVDSALDIYRRLLEHRPDDARLAERIREVESRASGQTEVVETPEAAAEPVAPRGPTIREFLVALVGGNSGVADFAPEASAEAQVAPFIPDESVSGSIDALFSDTEPSSGAESSVLAEAFSEQSSDAPMLEGRPSHPASNELSLDQVFKVATPVRTEAQPDGFSFDQFFAGEPNSSTASPPTNTPPAEGTDDIAQFNAWLNGLKKT